MEGSHFDSLARALSEVRSRRSLGGLFAALTVVGSLSTLSLHEVAAGGKHKHHHKKPKKHKRRKKRPNTTDTLVLGQGCTETKQCQGDLVCQVANSQNGFPERANQPVCCVPVDVHAKCDTGADCCGVSVICNGGYCQSA